MDEFDHSVEANEIVGTTIVFDDGRKGIICGGSLAYGWARSIDGAIAHEYSWTTLSRKVANGSQFPIN